MIIVLDLQKNIVEELVNMKAEYRPTWNASKQPRKQRKYIAKAPLHVKRKFLSVNLSKDLRKNHGVRNVEIRKGDTVKIMRGKFKKQTGKVTSVSTKYQKIIIENMQKKKADGSKVNVPLRASNLQITALDTSDKKRIIGKRPEKKAEKKEAKQETKKETPKKAESKVKQQENNK